MNTNRRRAARIAIWSLLNVVVLTASAWADTFSASFTNGFGDGNWARDQHIGVAGDPNDPTIAGNWSTGAYPNNGHAIGNPNTSTNVPGDNPSYDVVVGLNGCRLGTGVIIQTLNVGNGVTLTIAPNGLLAIAGGGVTNSGEIAIGDGTLHPGLDAPLLRVDSSGTVGGSGAIVLRGAGTTYNVADFTFVAPTVTHAAGHTVHGLGTIIGGDGSKLVNNGAIIADDPSGDLQLYLSRAADIVNENNSTIKAINGGTLSMYRGIVDQTGGGNFLADGDGSVVVLGGSTLGVIKGGSFDTANGGLIKVYPAGGGVTLDGVTNNGAFFIPHGNNPAVVVGTGMTNNGTITIGDGAEGSGFGTELRFETTALLDGSGTVKLTGLGNTFGLANLTITGPIVTHGASHTIHGRGSIVGGDGSKLVNNGAIIADDPSGDLQLYLSRAGDIVNENNSTIKAINGGTLSMYRGIVDQTGGGNFLADGDGSVVVLGGSTLGVIKGGSFDTANGGLIKVYPAGGGVTLDGVTNNGAFFIPHGNNPAVVVGTGMTNNGTITIGDGAEGSGFGTELRFETTALLDGSGTVKLTGLGNTFGLANLTITGPTVTHGASHTIHGRGSIVGGDGSKLVNNGAIVADDPSGDLQLYLSRAANVVNENNSTIKSVTGAVLNMARGIVDQTGGGSFVADGPGSLITIGTGADAPTFIGGSLGSVNGGLVQAKYVYLRGNIAIGGAFETLPDGVTSVAATKLTNNGTITLKGNASVLRFDQNSTEISGSGAIILTPQGTFALSSAQDVVNDEGHTITGDGLISAPAGTSLTNNGILSPGLVTGKINFTGNYVQGTTGVLQIELGGTAAASEYDQLAVSGTATVAGSLNVTLLNGFFPSPADVFHVLTSTGVSGVFANVSSGERVNTADGHGSFIVTYSGGEVVLSSFGPAPSGGNTALRVRVSSPAAGGDSGFVTVTLTGQGIHEGATVRLQRAGHADVFGQDVVIAAGGTSLTARFDLNGKALGGWDVVVTNPGADSFTISAGFNVESGRTDQVWAELIGRQTIRAGQHSRFYLTYGNRGNVDAVGAVFLITVPRNVKIVPGPEFPAGGPQFVETENSIFVPLAISDLPPGATRTASFLVTSPAGNFDINLSALTPSGARASGTARRSRTISHVPVLAEIDNFPEQDQAAIAEALDVLTKTWSQANVTAWAATTEACEGAAAYRRAALIAQQSLPGSALEGWTIRVVTKRGNFGAAHVTNLITSPDGQSHYLVDNYVAPAILKMVPFGKGWVPIGIEASIDPGGYNVVDKLIDLSGGELFYSEQLAQYPAVCYMADHARKLHVTAAAARDPNDKVGIKGAGPENYITGEASIPYTIFFENKADATAPAQEVVITDQLETSKFDLDTFEFGAVSFGNDIVATPPPGLSEWITDMDLRPAQQLIVRLIAVLDKATGVITWRFFSLDPATMQPTDDPLAGFLPPNQTAPEGDGTVIFSVRPKASLAAGTEIRNQAEIVFDTNAPIATPVWLNTIDNSTPESHVLSLPAAQAAPQVELSWTGDDTGSGIASYTIYVSKNGGAFVPWLEDTTATSGLYDADPGATYQFFSVAHDQAGNQELAPSVGDASIGISTGALLNISTRMRVLTGDNVLIGGFIVTGTDPKTVIIRGIGPSLPVAGALQDTTLDLYDGSGAIVASNDNWKEHQAEVEASTIPPTNDAESAIVATLPANNAIYTAILRGKDGNTGVGLVELYDLDQAANSRLANISTRGFVDTGDDVMIGGVIAGPDNGTSTKVLVRGIGPSLANSGIAGALENPTLELRDLNGTLIAENDDWRIPFGAGTAIEATSIAPTDDRESAIIAVLAPGNYTAIVRGAGETTGVGLVEVYNVQ